MTAPAGPESAGDTGRVRGLRREHRREHRPPRLLSGLRLRHLLLITAVLAVLAVAVLRSLVVDVYTVHQDSMHPTLADGERMLVDRTVGEGDVARGDVIVFDGTGSFTPYDGDAGAAGQTLARIGHWFGIGSPPETYVKRVIGVEGDRITCCDSDGRLTVDGEPAHETYLGRTVSSEDPASRTEFDVEVPPGRLWVMGDNRHDSVDSRDLLGAPGGGMIGEDRVIGEAAEVFWPWSDRRGIAAGPSAAPSADLSSVLSSAEADRPETVRCR
ncbi:MAG: signal peptidase I [Nesterenkonia sp.]|nr:signal peptidase I [Nesterenkonia sp.]